MGNNIKIAKEESYPSVKKRDNLAMKKSLIGHFVTAVKDSYYPFSIHILTIYSKYYVIAAESSLVGIVQLVL